MGLLPKSDLFNVLDLCALVKIMVKIVGAATWKFTKRSAAKNQVPLLLQQAFLDFRGFDFREFQFNVFYNSILFSSPLVVLSNLDLRGFRFPPFFYVSPH